MKAMLQFFSCRLLKALLVFKSCLVLKREKRFYSYWAQIFFISKKLLSTCLWCFLFTKNQQSQERQPGLTSVCLLQHILSCSCLPVVVSLFLLSPTKHLIFLCSTTSVAHTINGLRMQAQELTWLSFTWLLSHNFFLYDMI